MTKLKLPLAVLLVFVTLFVTQFCCLPVMGAGGTGEVGRTDGVDGAGGEEYARSAGTTSEYRNFLAARAADARDAARQESSGGYLFTLTDGRLIISDQNDAEIWHSKDEWYVGSFETGDVNRDQILDFVFTLWKSYSPGAAHPARIAEDGDFVRQHLYAYSIKDGRVKQLWCSSYLPRPIYAFELSMDGEQTPTESGARLVTREGAYTDDYSETASAEYAYVWSGWGFSRVLASAVATAVSSAAAAGRHLFEASPPVYSAKLAVVGDIMCHEAQHRDALAKGGGAAYDYSYAFRHIAPYISAADYAVGNLETTVALPQNEPTGYPVFGAPPSFAEAIKNAGFDFVTTANNHSLDFRGDGLLHTLQVLDGLGLSHTGTYANEADSRNISIVSVNNITFAILSYTYGTNGIPIPRDMPWCINADTEKIVGDIARAKALDPDVIMVLPHIGEEYETTPREIFKDEVHELLEAGADIVLASHPHVLQPVEFVTVLDGDGTERNCFAAYSLGNFISSQRVAPRDYGMIANLSFKKSDGETVLESVELAPVWVKFTAPDGSNDITVLPVDELDKPEFADVVNGLRPDDVRRINDVKSEFDGMYAGFTG